MDGMAQHAVEWYCVCTYMYISVYVIMHACMDELLNVCMYECVSVCGARVSFSIMLCYVRLCYTMLHMSQISALLQDASGSGLWGLGVLPQQALQPATAASSHN